MISPLRIMLSASLLILALPTGHFGDTQSEKIDKILTRLEEKFSSTEAFEYRFTMTKTLIQLTEPFTLEGRVVFRKPHFLRMEFRGEENLDIYVNGEFIWLVDLDLEEVENFDYAEMSGSGRLARLLPPLFLEGVSDLKERFEVSLLEIEGDEALRLRPKGTALSPAEIVFSADSQSRLRWMRVKWPNGDSTDTRFRGWKKMPNISRYYFTYLKK